ncbi:MAG: 50S ribosomal protein L20 [Fibrobacter sp.]|jgi:large subunit ribosomal protein L20|nr:50S ribosomal protein L20 [Fibrobacter sp.]
MPRAKNRVASRAKRKKLLSQTAGNFGKRNNCYSIAKDTFLRAGVYAYRDRKQNKRNFRSLWIMRINAAARLNGMAYGKFISGLKAKGIELDRKSLAHLALHEPDAFKLLVETVKA